MKSKFLFITAMVAGTMLAAPAAFAQPETKLTTNLSRVTINAIWCSALFLEESYYWDEGSDDQTRYEDMAYDIGAQLDDIMGAAGIPYVESEEIWSIFDAAANDFAYENESAFFDELDACEAAYTDKKLRLE